MPSVTGVINVTSVIGATFVTVVKSDTFMTFEISVIKLIVKLCQSVVSVTLKNPTLVIF